MTFFFFFLNKLSRYATSLQIPSWSNMNPCFKIKLEYTLEIYFTHFNKILLPYVYVTGGEQLSFNLELNPGPLAFLASALTTDL